MNKPELFSFDITECSCTVNVDGKGAFGLGNDHKHLGPIIAHRVNTYPALIEALEKVGNTLLCNISPHDHQRLSCLDAVEAALEAAKGDSDA